MAIYWNLPTAELYRDALKNNSYTISSTGALVAYSGNYTGRSPKDKRIVYDKNTKDIWWGKINMKIEKDLFNFYYNSSLDYLSDLIENKNKSIYIVDAYAGWDKNHRIKVRILCTDPYHALFMENMLIPAKDEFDEPDFTIVNVGEIKLSDVEDKKMGVKKDETLKDNLVAIDLTQMKMVIYGTRYAGEMKKGVLTVMMYLMQNKNMLTLHSSANIDKNGNTSLFFGLSGTGKTTLSAEKNRKLIGDDEHVWTDEGIFNVEGGCYAKCIGLKKENEPEIFNAIRYGAVLENVMLNQRNDVNFDDISITHNTRCAYPLHHIDNAIFPSVGNHPNNIILLTCDAFGVLPPVSKLTPKKAVFFFISGYTSKMPGTEVGVDKPKMVFSTCFAAPFIIWQPEKYGMLLEEKLNKHNTNVWLVNTGWIEGEYGVGRRIPIKHTRKIIDSIHNNELNEVEYENFPHFDIMIPKKCGDIPEKILNPSKSWSDEKLYDNKLKELFDNFKKDFVDNYGLELFNKLN